jgi:hypothetical protein
MTEAAINVFREAGYKNKGIAVLLERAVLGAWFAEHREDEA